MPIAWERMCKINGEFPGADCKFQIRLVGLEMNVSSKRQVDSYCSPGALVVKVIFYLLSLSDPIIQDGHPGINRHLA